MTVPLESFSLETLTLPHEDPGESAALGREWTTAYPDPCPVERGLMAQAVRALIELRRLARIRAVLRIRKVRRALHEAELEKEDLVEKWLLHFNDGPPAALVRLLRSAAGCRWAIAKWMEIDAALQADGTLYGEERIGAIQLQGQFARFDHLFYSEAAFNTWADCLACEPHPKQCDIDRVLDPEYIPMSLIQRNAQIWPRDVDACRARLRALVDRELKRLRALEETLRTQFEEPERAEAEAMALASVSKEETQLLRDQRMHEQSYMQASTALVKLRGRSPAASARREQPEAEPARDDVDSWFVSRWRPRGEGRAVRGTNIGGRGGRGAGKHAGDGGVRLQALGRRAYS